MALLESLRALLSAQGVETKLEWALDGGRQLAVLVPAEKRPRIFCVAFRPEGVFILGFTGIFRLSRSEEAFETIAGLAHRVVGQPNFVFDRGEFPFEPYPYKKWLDDGRLRVATERTESGWIAIPDQENEELWTTFTRRFSFRMSISPEEWPGIGEPAPFVTWSTRRMWEVYDKEPTRFETCERYSLEQMLQALLDIGANAPMYALDMNHDGYSFDPRVAIQRGLDTCPVPLIPVHNYSLFTVQGFSMGLFGHPWEGTICVFGDLLVERLVANPLFCFGEVMRTSTRPDNH